MFFFHFMLKTYQPANAKQNLDLEWPCFVITRPIYMLIMLGPFVRTQYFYTVKLYNINIHLYDYWVILGPIKLLCTAKSCTCIYNHLNYLMAIQLSLLKQLSTYCTTLWLKSFFFVPYRWNWRGLMVCALYVRQSVSLSHFSGSWDNF